MVPERLSRPQDDPEIGNLLIFGANADITDAIRYEIVHRRLPLVVFCLTTVAYTKYRVRDQPAESLLQAMGGLGARSLSLSTAVS